VIAVLLRRAALAGPLLWVVSTVVFALLHLIPGDPIDFMIGENATLDRKAELTAAYGLDRPLFLDVEALRSARPLPSRLIDAVTETQYAAFYTGLFTGELRSLHTRRPVWDTLADRFPMTLRLAGCALLVSILIAVPLGTLAAWKRGTWIDQASMAGALLGVSMPNFWLGPLLILVFAVELGWFPVSGATAPGSIVLPAVTLGLGMSAILTRITRASVLETLHADFVRTARAKGLSEMATLFRHALRAALLPVITIVGLQFGALLTGSIITEEIFGWPGIGREVIQAIRSRDFPMVQGCVLLIAATYIVVNTVTDVAYTMADPRVRLGDLDR
jgi:peptide/nickel transport system permease protein